MKKNVLINGLKEFVSIHKRSILLMLLLLMLFLCGMFLFFISSVKTEINVIHLTLLIVAMLIVSAFTCRFFMFLSKEKSERETLLLNGLLNSIPDIIFFKNKEGQYLGCNNKFCEFVGLEKEQIIGKTDNEIFPKEKADFYVADENIIIETKNQKQNEEWVRFPDKKLALLDTLKAPLFNSKNEVIGLLGVSRDITEKKQAKELVKSSMSLLKEKDVLQNLLMESTGKGYILFDLAKNIVLVNDTFFEMLELPQEARNINKEPVMRELVAKNLLESQRFINNALNVPDLSEKIKDIYELKSGKILECMHIGHLWVFSDITALKKAEVERQRFFEVSLDLLCIAGFDGYFKTLSPTWFSTLGWTEEELKSKPVIEFVYEEDRACAIEFSKSLIEGKNVELLDNRFLCKDGSYKWLSWKGIGLKDQKLIYGVARDITERKEIVEQIKESENRFKSMFYNHSAIMALIDPESSKILDCNEAAVKFYGYPKEKIINMTIFDIDTELREVAVKKFAEVEDKTDLLFEREHRLADGSLRNMEVRMATIDISGKKIMFAILNDITEKKQAEEQIKESENRFKSMFYNHSAIMLLIDPENGNILDCNTAAINFYGYSKEKLINMTVFDFDSLENKELLKKIIETGSKKDLWFEREHRLADGTIKNLEIRIAPIDISGKKIDFAIMHDITKRKQAEKALTKNTERLSLAIKAGSVGIWEWDIINNILTWDEQMYALYGFPKENFNNINNDEFSSTYDTWINRLHPEDKDNINEEIQHALKGLKEFNTEFRIVLPGGAVRTVCVNSKLIRNEAGQPVTMIGTNWDITEQKRYEQEILNAKEAAESANKAKSNFLANMSHEIRTPMNGIMGFVDLLGDSELNEEQKDFVDEVKKSSKLLLTVINDILDFSKIEAGKMLMESIKFDIRSVIEDVTILAASNAKDKPVELNALVYSNVPQKLYGDPSRLKQVLNNLTNNAIKFTKEGEVVINVRLEVATDDEIVLKFEVSDTGIGIPGDKLELIFESFTQADTSATRKFGGTGLGLTICKKIVELMNGNISVISEDGKGSTFIFTACFKKVMEEVNVEPGSSIMGAKVLLIDDIGTNLKVAGYYLEESKCIVYKALNVEEAMSILKKNNDIQVIVIDYSMPNINGFEAATLIKSNENLKQIPLILLTSITHKGAAQRAKEYGFVGYLTKPIKKNDLISCINLLINNANVATIKQNDEIVTKHSIKEQEFTNKFKVLIAEDVVINQKLAIRILNNAGYSCDVANNGQEAIQAFKANNYDIILMDCQMPLMDGYEATAQIRKLENGEKHIPIIAMTANAIEGDDQKCLDAGMDDYIAKPIKKENLTLKVEKHLKFSETINGAIQMMIDENGFTKQEAVSFVNEYLETLPELLSQLNKAIEDKDLSVLKDRAHSLKGSSANMQFKELNGMAVELENQIKSNNMEAINELVRQISEIIAHPKS